MDCWKYKKGDKVIYIKIGVAYCAIILGCVIRNDGRKYYRFVNRNDDIIRLMEKNMLECKSEKVKI